MKKMLSGVLLFCSVLTVSAGKTLKLEMPDSARADATEILQKAIDSDVSKIILSKDASPWITRALILRSDLELVIEAGAELKAKAGEFKHLNDCLLNAIGCKNIIIRGPGSLIMPKKDYQHADRYDKSEWRHSINLRSCENILIANLKIIGSGGDGIYIGSRPNLKPWRGARFHGEKYAALPDHCKNITIDNCVIDDHHRQAISVISVENLLVRNTRMSNTDGTAPMAGIDFEPNTSTERLVNCVLENCLIESNKAYGFLIYSKLTQAAPPVSITVKDSIIKSGGRGIVLSMSPGIKDPAGGFIKFINCKIIDTADSGIEFRCHYANGWKAIFENCHIENTAVKQPGRSPVMISLAPSSAANTGNILFTNCTVEDKAGRALMQYNNLAGKPVVENVSGSVIFNGRKMDVAEYVREHKMDVANVLAMAKLELAELFPAGGYELKARSKSQPRLIFRDKVRFLIAADQGKTVEFTLKYQRISQRFKQTSVGVTVITPSGEKIKMNDAVIEEDSNYSFVAPEKGVYMLECDPKGNKLMLSACNSPFSVAMPESGWLALFKPNGVIYFEIPVGVEEFPVEISGENAETISAAIYIENKEVASADHISAPRIFSIKCEPSHKPRLGSIRLSKAVEDARIKLSSPLLPIFAADKAELITRDARIAP